MQHRTSPRNTIVSNPLDQTSADEIIQTSADTHDQLHAILDVDITKKTTQQWIPAVDISEVRDRFIIQVDLPGIKPNDIKVRLKNGVLTFEGQRETKAAVSRQNYFRIERVSGTFYRRFSLPDSASQEGPQISTDNGVVTITIAKKEMLKTHKRVIHHTPEKKPTSTSTHKSHGRLMSHYWGF